MADKLMKVAKGVTVIRDGRRVRPEINKNFKFSTQEVEDINKASPGTLLAPDKAEEGEAAAASTTTGSTAERSQAGARGGKKATTASKAAGEGADKTNADDDL